MYVDMYSADCHDCGVGMDMMCPEESVPELMIGGSQWLQPEWMQVDRFAARHAGHKYVISLDARVANENEQTRTRAPV